MSLTVEFTPRPQQTPIHLESFPVNPGGICISEQLSLFHHQRRELNQTVYIHLHTY